jgi:hypothetical protein
MFTIRDLSYGKKQNLTQLDMVERRLVIPHIQRVWGLS